VSVSVSVSVGAIYTCTYIHVRRHVSEY